VGIMTRATTSGQVVRTKHEPALLCIALSGKGVPGSGSLEQAVEAVARTSRALHELTRRRGHEWKPHDPEVRLRTPAGVRGGSGWVVRVAVPGFVTTRELREAAASVARHAEIAKNIRLVPLEPSEAARPGPVGRDRLPGQLRRARSGSPQHRAREAR
jgi:hypothetical protein